MSGWIRIISLLGVLALALGFVVSRNQTTRPPLPADLQGDPRLLREPLVHQAAGLLAYVAGDYPEAVSPTGAILDDEEFTEQCEVLEDIAVLLEEATVLKGDSDQGIHWPRRVLLQHVAELLKLVEGHGKPDEVKSQALQLRNALIVSYDLRCSPKAKPNLQLGERLFLQACAMCHGADGQGNTKLAKTMDPTPPDFCEPQKAETLSPYQSFNVITFGVPGTAMPSFEALTIGERWDVAFYVAALRFGGRADAVVAADFPQVDLPTLSISTDQELLAKLERQGHTPDDARKILQILRRGL